MTPIKVTKHYKEYREEIDTEFVGSIVDIETVGDFRKIGTQMLPQSQDFLGRYQDMKITTVGILSNNEIRISIARSTNDLQHFQRKAASIMKNADTPTYAFNKSFEEGCYYWNSGREYISLDFELQSYARESKKSVVAKFEIDNYDDPFYDEGRKCVYAFQDGDLREIVKHNRACLLKENQILQKRGASRIETKWLDLPE